MTITMRRELNQVKQKLAEVEIVVRSLVIKVNAHDERFDRIEKRLEKLDVLDTIQSTLEAFTSEIIASRKDRALMGLSFAEERAALLDHELRITRLERRDKPS